MYLIDPLLARKLSTQTSVKHIQIIHPGKIQKVTTLNNNVKSSLD